MHFQNWSLTVGVLLDGIWFARNDLVFANNSVSLNSIYNKAQRTIQASIQSINIARNLDLLACSQEVTSAGNWNPPPRGFVKVNVDGSVRRGGSSAGCGGIARDHESEFLFAFL